MKITDIKHFFSEKTIIKDGAMGTEILRRGIETPIPLWSAYALIANPEIVKQIHIDYIQAGATIITTDTFRTTKRMLIRAGYPAEKAREITILACKLAKEAIAETKTEGKVLIAGSVAPLEDCYSPELTPSDKELQQEHHAYAKDLKDGGADFILIETMITIREILAACEAAKKVGLPLGVSFCCDDKGNLLSGESLAETVKAVMPYSPLFFGINCMSSNAIKKSLPYLLKETTLPVMAYAQGDGSPEDTLGWKFKNNEDINEYVAFTKAVMDNGVRIIGGCCGTSPEYIKAIVQAIKN